MFTRCPECETTFRVSAEDLRRAQGKVRCGDCDEVFNAVEYLTEDPAPDDSVDTDIEATHSGNEIIPEPANETGIHEIPAADAAYELEIKAYEKTGETSLPLGAEEESEALHIDLEGDSFGTEDDFDSPIDPAFETIGESETIEMEALVDDDDDLPTLEMPIPDDLRRDKGPAPTAEQSGHDDDIWEPIPGVGATEPERNIDVEPQDPDADGYIPLTAEDAIADSEAPDDTGNDDQDPEDKWQSFFGAEPKPPAYTDTAEQEFSEPDEEVRDEPETDSEETTQPVEPDWDAMEPLEEVVMATGEFGAAEISSSLTDKTDQSEEHKGRTYTDDDWQPEDWQPEEQPEEDEESWIPRPGADQREPVSTKTLILSSLIAVLLFGSFTGQLVHYQRDKLAAHPAWGQSIRSAYAALGMTVYPTWPTDAYEIRGSEAVSGESGPDVMDIRGQIASVSNTTIGLPLLRVVLRDRWSNPVAAKVFTPEQYALPGAIPDQAMLQANQTIATHVAIVDPGSGAQGFELEVCLPRRDSGLECSGQDFP